MQISQSHIEQAEIVYTGSRGFAWLYLEAAGAGIFGIEDEDISETMFKRSPEKWKEVRFMFAYLILLEAGEEI